MCASGRYKDIGIRNLKFVAKTQFLYKIQYDCKNVEDACFYALIIN